MRTFSLILLSAGALISSGAALAAPAKPAPAKTVVTKTTTAPRKLSGAAATSHAAKVAATQSSTAIHRTATGKTIRYDCTKAGNKTKKVCAK